MRNLELQSPKVAALMKDGRLGVDQMHRVFDRMCWAPTSAPKRRVEAAGVSWFRELGLVLLGPARVWVWALVWAWV